LGVVVPKSQIQHHIKLLRAERVWVHFDFHERAVVAVVAHVLVLFFYVELVGYDLESFCEVLKSIWHFTSFFVFVNNWEDDFALFDFGDCLRKDDAQLLCRKHIRVRGQALHLRQEEIETGIFFGAEVNEGL